jgi:type IV secretion system protein VirB4
MPPKLIGLSLEKPVPEFVPAACMYDKETVLTKNGELLQTVKITGFTHESIGSEHLDLRATIREAVREAVTSDKFSLWIHTIRRKCNLDPGGECVGYFASSLSGAWKETNAWDAKYVNEVYVTVLCEGKEAGVANIRSMLRSLYFNSYYKMHEKHLQDSVDGLHRVTNKMLEVLSRFGARKLGIYKRDGVYYSDYLQFFGKIMNLADRRYLVDMTDMAEQLASHKLAFGYNSFEVLGESGKHFGAAFSFKEYHEMSLECLDEVLQMPVQFIVTQTLDFVNSKQAMEEFEEQYLILQNSGSQRLMELSGLKDVVESDRRTETDFGEGQITLTLINDDVKALEEEVKDLEEVFRDLGLVAPRMDVGLEDVYWSQLPGNFAFIAHKKKINAAKIGGLASLFNFPAGRRFDNRWGPAMTIFHTAKGTPYFFNYHDGDNGHTSIIGPKGMGKTALMNFMLSESRKVEPRLFFFDPDGQSKVFVKALGGTYRPLCATEGEAKETNGPADDGSYLYDPFVMATQEDERFLVNWLYAMMIYDPEEFGEKDEAPKYRASFDEQKEEDKPIETIKEPDTELLTRVVRQVVAMKQEGRNLTSVFSLLPAEYAACIRPFLPGKKYGYLFSSQAPYRLFEGAVHGFGMQRALMNPRSIVPITYMLLYEIEKSLDGSPAIIVLDEAWSLVNNRFFGLPSRRSDADVDHHGESPPTRLEAWLDRMTEKNAVVVVATENVRNACRTSMTDKIVAKIATRIFLPNRHADDYSISYHETWMLSDTEFEMLSAMSVNKREFMIKQGKDAIVCRLDLSDMEQLPALSASAKYVEVMEEAMRKKGPRPEDWLPEYYKESVYVGRLKRD